MEESHTDFIEKKKIGRKMINLFSHMVLLLEKGKASRLLKKRIPILRTDEDKRIVHIGRCVNGRYFIGV